MAQTIHRPRGRPRQTPVVVQVRLSEAEHDALVAAAARSGVSISHAARRAIQRVFIDKERPR